MQYNYSLSIIRSNSIQVLILSLKPGSFKFRSKIKWLKQARIIFRYMEKGYVSSSMLAIHEKVYCYEWIYNRAQTLNLSLNLFLDPWLVMGPLFFWLTHIFWLKLDNVVFKHILCLIEKKTWYESYHIRNLTVLSYQYQTISNKHCT